MTHSAARLEGIVSLRKPSKTIVDTRIACSFINSNEIGLRILDMFLVVSVESSF